MAGVENARTDDVAGRRLRVRVAPGARRSELVGRHGTGWKVRVTSTPERGRANDEVLELLSETLGVRKTELRIAAGRSSRDKLVELAGLPLDEAERRLAAARGSTA